MSGWGGWGNWISSTVNSVVKEFGEAMKDLDENQVSTASKDPQSSSDATSGAATSSEPGSVDSNATVATEASSSESTTSAPPKTRKVVADGVAKEEIEITDGNDDEGGESAAQPSAATNEGSPSVPTNTAAKKEASTPSGGEELKEREDAFKKEEEMLDTFENALDQGAAFLTSTTSFLGGLLHKGIDIVKNSEEVAFISVKAKSVANTSKKIVEDMTTGSLDEGFEASQTVALNALEAVGKKAFELLTTTSGTPEKPRLRPIYLSEQFDALSGSSEVGAGAIETPTIKPDSLAHFFDEAFGSTHEKAIELLSSNCILMTQKKQRLLSPEELSAFNSMIAKIQNVFENEDEVEDVSALEEKVFAATVNSKVSSHREKLLELESQILKHIFERANASLNQSGKEGLSKDVLVQDFRNLVAEIRKDSMKHFGEFSAGVVEQIMRVAESYLIAEDEKVTQEQAYERALEKALYIHQLTLVLSSHIGKITSAYINCLQQISQSTIEELGQIESESSEQNPAQVVEDEVSRNSNDILFDSSEATSYISDAEKMVINICKWLLLSWKEEPAKSNSEPNLSADAASTPAPAPAPAVDSQTEEAPKKPEQQVEESEDAATPTTEGETTESQPPAEQPTEASKEELEPAAAKEEGEEEEEDREAEVKLADAEQEPTEVAQTDETE